MTPVAFADSPFGPDISGSLFRNRSSSFSTLANRRTLVIFDVENISLVARGLGFRVSYETVAKHITSAIGHCWLHAFFAASPNDWRRINDFKSAGWMPHPWNIAHRAAPKSPANSDNPILFHAGILASSTECETVILGTGDGVLGADLALLLSGLRTRPEVKTMSFPESTSWLLKAGRNPLITENIPIEGDALVSIAACN